MRRLSAARRASGEVRARDGKTVSGVLLRRRPASACRYSAIEALRIWFLRTLRRVNSTGGRMVKCRSCMPEVMAREEVETAIIEEETRWAASQGLTHGSPEALASPGLSLARQPQMTSR
jgi:hypothetical protein